MTLALATATASGLQAQVVTYNQFANSGQYTFIPNCYVENGFRTTSVGQACGESGSLGVWGSGLPQFEAPDVAVFNNYGQSVMFTLAASGAFSLSSIDLFPIYGPTNSTINILFSGTHSDLSVNTFNFAFDGNSTGYSTATFDPNLFSDLTSATLLSSSDTFVQFDNITFNATSAPEPASLGLFATGLIGVVGAIKRRRR